MQARDALQRTPAGFHEVLSQKGSSLPGRARLCVSSVRFENKCDVTSGLFEELCPVHGALEMLSDCRNVPRLCVNRKEETKETPKPIPPRQ